MIRHKCHRRSQFGLLLFGLVLDGMLLQALLPSMSQAQVTTAITSDGTLGTTVTQNGKFNDITGGTRPRGGPNLFHSFGQFSVGAGDVASFNGPAEIANVLSRVTGGDPSNIFGTIRSTIDGANLFLMNPAGVLFGPTASLDVSGSFHITSADYLRLTDNVQFTAVPGPSDTVLSIAPVTAFGFLGPNPARITYNGTSDDDGSSLNVPDGEALSFVGGDISIVGDGSLNNSARVSALSGQVKVASVASGGEVIADTLELAPNVVGQSFESLGEIVLLQGALINVSGVRGGGGTVTIRGGRLMVDNSFVFADIEGDLNGATLGIDIDVARDLTVKDSNITTDVFGAGKAGDIRVEAGYVHLMGTPSDVSTESQARIGSLAFRGFTGATGNVTVTTGNLQIEGQSEITTTVRGAEKGGDITVMADAVSISGTSNSNDFTGIFSNTRGSGPGGLLEITADTLKLTNQAFLQSLTRDSGKAGGVTVTLTGNLDVREGSFILVDSNSAGNAADLTITAKDISITGIRDAPDPDALGVFTGIDSSAEGTGQGGNMKIMAENLQLTDNATISTSSTEIGSLAGNINIKINDSILIENSTVTTEAEQADGGDITLMAPNIIRLIDSEITTSVGGGPQTTGGNIEIDPRFVILDNESNILAQAGQGTGGRIDISTDFLFASLNAIDASSDEGGIDGTVDIDSPATDIIAGTLELPESFLNVQSLLSTRCASRTTKPASSFFVTNGGLPLGPDTLIPTGVTGVGINSGGSDGPQSDHSDEIPELPVRTSAFGGCTYEMM